MATGLADGGGASTRARCSVSCRRWVYGDPGSKLLLLGITGTNGKTTTSYLLDGGLSAAGHRTG